MRTAVPCLRHSSRNLRNWLHATSWSVVLGEIAWIDADLVGHCGCGDGHLRGEVDVGHQGNGNAHCPETGLYLPERLHLSETLGGEPDQLRAGLIQVETLLYGSVQVIGVAVAHTLDDGPACIVSDEQAISYICSDVAHIYLSFT